MYSTVGGPAALSFWTPGVLLLPAEQSQEALCLPDCKDQDLGKDLRGLLVQLPAPHVSH